MMGSSHQLKTNSINVEGKEIEALQRVKCLGAWIDPTLSFKQHTTKK